MLELKKLLEVQMQLDKKEMLSFFVVRKNNLQPKLKKNVNFVFSKVFAQKTVNGSALTLTNKI